MNNYLLVTSKTKDYTNNNKFIKEFNQIFNKIPHIYSEIFLTLFQNKFSYLTMYNDINNKVSFIKVLERIFYNRTKINNKTFYYQKIKKDLQISLENIKDETQINNISHEISTYLSSNIDIKLLLDIVDKKIYNKNYIKLSNIETYSNHDKVFLYQIISSYLISKVLIKIIIILNNYNYLKNTSLYNSINSYVEKIRTWDLIMDNVLDIYDNKYKNIINKNEFKILIYLLSISKNGKDLDNNYKYNLDKIFMSIGYDTKVRKVINYKKASDYLEVLNNKYNYYINELFNYREYPIIYENISDIIEILYYKKHDNYKFITSKDKILKELFYLFIKEVDLQDKLIMSSNFKLWEYEWDSIKNKYQLKYQ